MEKATLIPEPTTALILAGGRGSRLGGIEKGEIELDGRRLIDIVVEGALSAGCEGAVIAGRLQAEHAVTVKDETPFGGPVSGLSASLPEIKTDWVMLLACDLPHARLLCHLLSESFHHLEPDFDGLVALTDFRVQWLAGIYRRSSLAAALERVDEPAGLPLRALLGDLKLREVQDPEGLARDIDTPEQLAALKGGKEPS